MFEQICSIDNLRIADKNAQKGKSKQKGVIEHNKVSEANLKELRHQLLTKTYKTAEYTTFTIFEPKERLISELPYFPDRIAQHAVMNVMETWFVNQFTTNTFSCLKGRGIKGASDSVRKYLQDVDGTKYCLKLDITKFYPSVDNDILKSMLRRKIKDADLLWLLDDIIDSNPKGLPLGNFTSQFFSNFYLNQFDHWLKQSKQVKYYARYADDIVILSDSKEYLHGLLSDIKSYLLFNLKLHVKNNHQVFPVAARGIDFVGFVHFHTHIGLRKSIKQNFCRMMANNPNQKSIASYNGWLTHCDGQHLLKKLLSNEELQRLRHKNTCQNIYRGKDTNA